MKKNSLLILLFLGSLQLTFCQDFIFSQKDCERSSCEWDFFDLEKTVQGEVLCHEYLPQNFSCRGLTYNSLISIVNNDYQMYSFCPGKSCLSMTILKVNQDTIRVLSFSEESYEIGAQLYIVPDKTIRKENEELHFIAHALERTTVKKKRGWKKEYKKAQAQLPDRFDEVVLKTTRGSLSDKSDEERKVSNCEKDLIKPIMHNSFQCYWNFFELEKPLNGTIVKYEAQIQPCTVVGYASLAIVAIENTQDTFRVLDACNSSTFKEGNAVIVEAGIYYNPLYIPYTKTTVNEQVIYQTNEFDASILRTTYGKIKNKE